MKNYKSRLIDNKRAVSEMGLLFLYKVHNDVAFRINLLFLVSFQVHHSVEKLSKFDNFRYNVILKLFFIHLAPVILHTKFESVENSNSKVLNFKVKKIILHLMLDQENLLRLRGFQQKASIYRAHIKA